MDFRQVLRDGTRAQHDCLDDMITTLDIAKPVDFARFVAVHLSSFRKMYDTMDTDSYAQSHMCQMIACLSQDLETLGGTADTNTDPNDTIYDPLAVDYIVAGSRLGSKVLKKRWSKSCDPVVQRSSAYFSLTTDKSFWPSTCQALAQIEVESTRAQAIIRDTKSLFQLFSSAFQNTDAKNGVAA